MSIIALRKELASAKIAYKTVIPIEKDNIKALLDALKYLCYAESTNIFRLFMREYAFLCRVVLTCSGCFLVIDKNYR